MEKIYLGVEFGSTRIKAVGIDENFNTRISSDYTWKSSKIDGIWTYNLDEAFDGLRAVLKSFKNYDVVAMGISGMMHGYLAFDKEWKLLTPFRTWQNTITGQASKELTELFDFNIPQRWSIAHLYQAILNKEEHVKDIAHITTLAGYIHYMLTGENIMGVGEASGMFPIDSDKNDFHEQMIIKFDEHIENKGLSWKLREILPEVASAGQKAGHLTKTGSELLGGILKPGIEFVPCEGDAGTGMTATNAVAVRTGNVSAGTSIFSMLVLEKPLSRVYPEIDMVTTPTGRPVAMVHCNNCTNDMNAWVGVIKEIIELFGIDTDISELYGKLYNKSMEGAPDCGDVMVYNYISGEEITHIDGGIPLVLRRPESTFKLADFLRAQLYSTMATLKLGMDILAKEKVAIDSLSGHGGLFKTPLVGQKYMAAACNAPIICMENSGEGGPYGMALLAAFSEEKELSLEEFLAKKVFANVKATRVEPSIEDVQGFEEYIKRFNRCFDIERKAVEELL